jgi:hypothetical protein
VKTLPSGETLKGTWDISGYAPEGGGFESAEQTSVSFAIPLHESPVPHFIRAGEEDPEGCTGEVKEPGAKKGNLCVFAAVESNSAKEFAQRPLPRVCNPLSMGFFGGECATEAGASRYGFGVVAVAEQVGVLFDYGSWAVTAE